MSGCGDLPVDNEPLDGVEVVSPREPAARFKVDHSLQTCHDQLKMKRSQHSSLAYLVCIRSKDLTRSI